MQARHGLPVGRPYGPRDGHGQSLYNRSFSSDNQRMTGNQFLRKLKALGNRRGVVVKLDATRGKGSHQTVYFGAAFTIIRNPKDELRTGTFHAMCTQLGVNPRDL